MSFDTRFEFDHFLWVQKGVIGVYVYFKHNKIEKKYFLS